MSRALLFARIEGESVTVVAIAAAMTMTFLFAVLILYVKQYKRCPTNRVLVVYGKAGSPGQTAKVIHGGAMFVVPLLQDYAYLSLEPIRTTISLPAHMLSEQLGFELPRTYTVAIGTTPELMQNAAMRMLGLSSPEIERHANDTILDALSGLIQAMGDDVDSETLHAKLEDGLRSQLQPLGLELVSFRRA